MTPLACGNPFVGFVPTSFFGARRDGITLGTAMAISGAAVSPNQGYHSSPIVGLLLMLFNVRLGWWLGNPRSGPKFYRREGPLLSILPVLDELAGRARKRRRAHACQARTGVDDLPGEFAVLERSERCIA
jgi:hypothetical protein